jgi:hypothetical protein
MAAATAYRYFTYLSPAHRSRHATRGAAYAIEPYVMAGDVYSQPPYVGRGGWSWYTGAAAWMHRAAIESIFGLQLRAHELSFAPCLPTHWQRAELTLRRDGRTLRFVLVRAGEQAALAATAPLGARLLRRSEALRWFELAADACVPLQAMKCRAARQRRQPDDAAPSTAEVWRRMGSGDFTVRPGRKQSTPCGLPPLEIHVPHHLAVSSPVSPSTAGCDQRSQETTVPTSTTAPSPRNTRASPSPPSTLRRPASRPHGASASQNATGRTPKARPGRSRRKVKRDRSPSLTCFASINFPPTSTIRKPTMN